MCYFIECQYRIYQGQVKNSTPDKTNQMFNKYILIFF